ncbi:hypothetical protein HL658_29155 [Azospirillum sp. RWY-5-1]|uniref:Uncharacterized protein n=1 Tax=Azospirillum oleiclasticum TaxID=2735135 RepID=A0ABX2TIF2_9PROT|nr:hypothetical protein [Azospirillum oleiclasticum]NYZ16633.1 hypothetical protein [Azospirillum oleiclasticum]NYZ24120.1 hypothetical protein [Azospirillum oleiclasticum]
MSPPDSEFLHPPPELKQIPPVTALNKPDALGDGDDKAEKEANAIARGDLEDIASKKEHGRREEIRDELLWHAKWTIRFVGAMCILAVAVFSFHYLAPANWHWLNEDQLGSVKTFLFSGAVIGVASKFSTRYW